MASPNPVAGALATFAITANGSPIDAAIEVVAIDSWAAFGAAPRARIAIFDGSPADQTFAVSSSPTFAPGASIAIALGYDNRNQTIFSGTVTAQKLEIAENSPSRLIVEAAGKDVTLWSGSVPAPVLAVTFGDSILTLNATTSGSMTGGDVRFAGSTLAVPGAAMRLAGLGRRFDGTVLITGVHQGIRDGLWTTTANFGEAPEENALTLLTPGGNSIRLDDAAKTITVRDANGNSATLSAAGISLDSASNVQIAAKGNIDITARGNLALKAGATVSVEGLQIVQSAKAKFSAQGAAQAELTSSGIVTVQGSLIKIN